MTTLLIALFFACGDKGDEVDTSSSEETGLPEESGDTATSEEE